MIDFHTHILPCVDDGSRSIEQSLAMLQMEASQGIDTVILTPHFYASQNSPLEFLRRRHKMLDALREKKTDALPEFFVGAEVQYFEGICTVEEIRYLRIQGTDYLLLEMPFSHWSDRVISDAAELADMPGITLVLAHIERYMGFHNMEALNYLRKCGVLMQCNVSFFGDWRTRHKAVTMLNRGEIQFLGSDCHNLDSRRPNWNLLPDKARAALLQSAAYQQLDRALHDSR